MQKGLTGERVLSSICYFLNAYFCMGIKCFLLCNVHLNIFTRRSQTLEVFGVSRSWTGRNTSSFLPSTVKGLQYFYYLQLLNIFKHPVLIERAKSRLWPSRDNISRFHCSVSCVVIKKSKMLLFDHIRPSSRYVIFSGPNIPRSQGWSLWDVCDGRRQRIMLFLKQNFN